MSDKTSSPHLSSENHAENPASSPGAGATTRNNSTLSETTEPTTAFDHFIHNTQRHDPRLDIIQALLEVGADPNSQTSGVWRQPCLDLSPPPAHDATEQETAREEIDRYIKELVAAPPRAPPPNLLTPLASCRQPIPSVRLASDEQKGEEQE
ncbi:hypothetical protein GE09DRAFT_1227255 [Coniochaeta sp. 2T2.1]|nr:hypothetical protein GE09DRAFT_1227255 [Coniochaeta sp. 2T2.1]